VPKHIRARAKQGEYEESGGGRVELDVKDHLSAEEELERFELDLAKALEGMEVSMDQFIDICVLAGCDYAETIPATPPPGADQDRFVEQDGLPLSKAVHDLIASLNGSISAEHGIGRLKREELAWRKSAVEMDMMRAVKAALDPQGRMNPGRVL
jgi:FAD/FMN-containing dehydrogenase